MAELREILAGRAPLREHVAVVTFDDGYRDNFHNAMPILTKLGVPATFFLSVDFVDRHRPFWFDALAHAMRRWDADPVVRQRGRLALPESLQVALATSGSFASRLGRAAAGLKTLPDPDREAAVRALAVIAGEGTQRGTAEPMTWDDVRAMREQGMHFGAHGIRHAILTRMPPASAEEEIQRSLEVIEARTGTAVREFAYPNGDTDDEVARRAARSGVALAFTMRPASVRPGDDPHRIGRRNMCEDTSRSALGCFGKAYFWCEITGVFDWLLWRGRRGRG